MLQIGKLNKFPLKFYCRSTLAVQICPKSFCFRIKVEAFNISTNILRFCEHLFYMHAMRADAATAVPNIMYPVVYTSFMVKNLPESQQKCLIPLQV